MTNQFSTLDSEQKEMIKQVYPKQLKFLKENVPNRIALLEEKLKEIENK